MDECCDRRKEKGRHWLRPEMFALQRTINDHCEHTVTNYQRHRLLFFFSTRSTTLFKHEVFIYVGSLGAIYVFKLFLTTSFQICCAPWLRVRVYDLLRHYQQYFSYIVEVSFLGRVNLSTQRKPPICRKSLTNLIT